MNDRILAAGAAGPLPLLRLILFGLLTIAGSAVHAQTFTVTSIAPVGGGSIGTVTSDASGTTTTYKISATNGSTTRTSGSALPVNATGTRALVTIACSGDRKCTDGKTLLTATIKIDSFGTPTGRALALTNFNVAAGSGAPSATQGTGSTFTFTISGTWSTAKTFYLGADLRIAGTGATGSSVAQYLVTASGTGNPTGSTSTGSFSASVRRPISIARDSHLAFGTVVRPSAGSSTIMIDPTSGSRSITAGNAGLRASTTSRAQFTVTGESGQTFGITAPSALTMTSPGGGSIEVALSTSHANPVSISGGGTATPGTAVIGVGGTFTITSTTPVGAYSAVFPITVTYN